MDEITTIGPNPEVVMQQLDPLTKWENEPTVEDLKKDLEEATGHHQSHVDDVNRWLDHLNITGSAKIPKVKGRSTIVPRLIRKQAEWRYASLSEAFLSHEDLFTTEPVTFEDRDAAVQNGLVLNHQFNNQLDKVKLIDDYVRAGVDEGSVVVRVGWDFQSEMVEEPVYESKPITNPQAYNMVLSAMNVVSQNPESLNELPEELRRDVEASLRVGSPVQQVAVGTQEVEKTVINQPTVDVCDYNSVIIDPTCKGDIKKASFVIYRFETSKSDLEKSNINYQNLDQIEMDKNAIQHEANYHAEDTNQFNFQDEARKKFVAYEYWGYWDIDGSGKTKPIVGTWVGNTLIRLEESPFPDEGLPFVLVQYLPKRKHVYGEPDGALLEDNQKVAGATLRGMMDIMGRSAAGQIGVRKDALDVTNQRKFDNGLDYQFNPQIADARTAFHTHVFPEIPQSAPYMLNLQYQEAEAITGVKAFHQGITGEGLGRSATAARSAIDAAGKREMGILRRLAKGMVEIGRKIMAMNAVFLEEEEIIRITNSQFITIKRDDLAGRVDIKLHISSAETDNAKAQELAFMLQTNGPNGDPGETRMIRAEIARLRKMPDLAKRIQEFQPQPTPIEQLEMQKLQLEMEEIKARIAKLYSEAEENTAEAELDRAKARESDSKADLNTLDFVEQETGTKHARNMEQDQAQGEMNLVRDLVKDANKGSSGPEPKA